MDRPRDHGRRGRHTQPDPGRTRRRADGDRFVARRPSSSARQAATPGTARPALRRRRRRQDPAAHRAARPRLHRGLAGLRRPLPRLRRQRAALPARSPRCSAGWPPTCPTWSTPSPAVHPALARLQPGPPGAGRRRAAPSRRRSTAPTCSRPCTRCSRPPPSRPRCCWSSRTPTGPTSRPATCSASCSPGRSPARSRSSRRTAPTTCTAATRCAARSPSGPGSAASTGCSFAPLAAPTSVRLIAELGPEALAETELADIVDRAEGNAFFVEELVGAASGPGRWVPDDLADVLLVRLDRLDDHARQVVRAASVAGRKVSHEMLAAASGLAADRPRRGPAPGGRDERPGRRRGPLRLPARAARRGGVRRPAARRAGPAARGVRRRAARAARSAAPPPSWPATPGWRWTSTPRSPPASRPATRPAPSAARTRRRTTTSRRSSCSPTRAAAPTSDLDLSKLVVKRRRGADRPAATPSARPRWSASSSTGCPPTPRRPGGPGCSPPAPTRCRHRDRRGPGRGLRRGGRAGARRRQRRCAPGCSPTTPGSWRRWAATRRRSGRARRARARRAARPATSSPPRRSPR